MSLLRHVQQNRHKKQNNKEQIHLDKDAQTMTESTNTEKHSLDITGLICPMTFVRTKLALEKLSPGDILEVTLKGAEPLNNVPRSARQHGHSLLSTTERDDGTYLIVIRREAV